MTHLNMSLGLKKTYMNPKQHDNMSLGAVLALIKVMKKVKKKYLSPNDALEMSFGLKSVGQMWVVVIIEMQVVVMVVIEHGWLWWWWSLEMGGWWWLENGWLMVVVGGCGIVWLVLVFAKGWWWRNGTLAHHLAL